LSLRGFSHETSPGDYFEHDSENGKAQEQEKGLPFPTQALFDYGPA
jgi:hypothetical protein